MCHFTSTGHSHFLTSILHYFIEHYDSLCVVQTIHTNYEEFEMNLISNNKLRKMKQQVRINHQPLDREPYALELSNSY